MSAGEGKKKRGRMKNSFISSHNQVVAVTPAPKASREVKWQKTKPALNYPQCRAELWAHCCSCCCCCLVGRSVIHHGEKSTPPRSLQLDVNAGNSSCLFSRPAALRRLGIPLWTFWTCDLSRFKNFSMVLGHIIFNYSSRCSLGNDFLRYNIGLCKAGNNRLRVCACVCSVSKGFSFDRSLEA